MGVRGSEGLEGSVSEGSSLVRTIGLRRPNGRAGEDVREAYPSLARFGGSADRPPRDGTGGEIRVVVGRRADQERCPRCQRSTAQRHDARERAKADVTDGGGLVTLAVIRRRFRCIWCQRVFPEPDAICGDAGCWT
jgi:hypothetical protein